MGGLPQDNVTEEKDLAVAVTELPVNSVTSLRLKLIEFWELFKNNLFM